METLFNEQELSSITIFDDSSKKYNQDSYHQVCVQFPDFICSDFEYWSELEQIEKTEYSPDGGDRPCPNVNLTIGYVSEEFEEFDGGKVLVKFPNCNKSIYLCDLFFLP